MGSNMIMDRWQTENYMKRLEKDSIVRTVPITEGMTICFNNVTSYYEEKNKLKEAGFEMECCDDVYSIYILSCPYKYSNETIYRIK